MNTGFGSQLSNKTTTKKQEYHSAPRSVLVLPPSHHSTNTSKRQSPPILPKNKQLLLPQSRQYEETILLKQEPDVCWYFCHKILFIHHFIGKSSQYLRSHYRNCVIPPESKPESLTFTKPLSNSGRGFLYNSLYSLWLRFQLLSDSPYRTRNPGYSTCGRITYPICNPYRTYFTPGLPPPSPCINFFPARSDLAAGKQRFPILVPSPPSRLILMVFAIGIVGMEKTKRVPRGGQPLDAVELILALVRF